MEAARGAAARQFATSLVVFAAFFLPRATVCWMARSPGDAAAASRLVLAPGSEEVAELPSSAALRCREDAEGQSRVSLAFAFVVGPKAEISPAVGPV